MSLKPFSEVIKSRKKKLNLTYEDITNLTGLSKYRIQQMEQGHYKFKSIYEIERLVNALQMGERGKKMFIYQLSEFIEIPEFVYIPDHMKQNKKKDEEK